MRALGAWQVVSNYNLLIPEIIQTTLLNLKTTQAAREANVERGKEPTPTSAQKTKKVKGNQTRERLDKVELAVTPLLGVASAVQESETMVSELASTMLIFHDQILAPEEEDREVRSLKGLCEDVWEHWGHFKRSYRKWLLKFDCIGRGRANNGTKWKIAEPHTYDDVQDAKELDNSIFDDGKPENREKEDCYVHNVSYWWR